MNSSWKSRLLAVIERWPKAQQRNVSLGDRASSRGGAYGNGIYDGLMESISQKSGVIGVLHLKPGCPG
jgi:hypothetical protein